MANEEVVVDPATPPASGTALVTPPPAGSVPPAAAPPSGTPPAPNGEEAKRIRGLMAEVQKERKARQDFETRSRDYEARLAERDRQVAALTGARPPSAEEAEIEEVRGKFAELYPGLAKLTDEQIDRILSVADRSDELQGTTQHYWEKHGETVLASLAETVAEAVGVDELTERQIKGLNRYYIGECAENPEMLRRHEKGDPTLIKEIAAAYVEDWFDSARRKTAATEVARVDRRVPDGKGRHVARTQKKPIDYNDPKAVEDAMVESFADHGGRFGN